MVQHTTNLLPIFGSWPAAIKKKEKQKWHKTAAESLYSYRCAFLFVHKLKLLRLDYFDKVVRLWRTRFSQLSKTSQAFKHRPPTVVVPLPGSSWCPPLARLLLCRAPRSADRTLPRPTKLKTSWGRFQGHDMIVAGGEMWTVIEPESRWAGRLTDLRRRYPLRSSSAARSPEELGRGELLVKMEKEKK